MQGWTINSSKRAVKELTKRGESRATSKNRDTRARWMKNSMLKLVMIEDKNRVGTICCDEGTICIQVSKNIARESLRTTEADRARRRRSHMGDANRV